MSLITTTGFALILTTLIYHGGLVFLYARAELGRILSIPRGERLFIIAKHSDEYEWGCRVLVVAWITAAVAYVMLTMLLRDAGDSTISTLASVLFLLGIASAIGFWAISVPVTVFAADQAERTGVIPEYYERHQLPADSLLRVYTILGLVATAGFGWALIQTGILPGWVGWVTLGWGLVFAGISTRTRDVIPLLPMVMQLVIGISLLVK